MTGVFLAFLAEYLATKALDIAGGVTGDQLENGLFRLSSG